MIKKNNIMKKNILLEKEIKKIKSLFNTGSLIINENANPINTIISLFAKNFNDDTAKSLGGVFRSLKSSDFLVKADGRIVLRSASKTEYPVEIINDALLKITKGEMEMDDLMKLLPAELLGGTKTKPFVDELYRKFLEKGNIVADSKPLIQSRPTPPIPPAPNIPDANAFRKFLQGIKLAGDEFLVENLIRLSSIFKEKYYQNLGDINVLQQEFNNLAKNVLTKVDPKNPKIVDAELTKMSTILAKVGYRKDLQLKVIWDAWKKEMPDEFAQRLGSWENQKFQQLVTYFEKLDPAKFKTAPLATYTKLEGLLSLFKKKQTVSKYLQRVGFMITHLDPRTAAEINNSIKIYGFWRAVGKGVGQKFIVGFVILPFFYSILKTLLDYADLTKGISLGLGEKQDIISSTEIDQNIGDNISDVLTTATANFFRAYPVIGNDYRTLLAWSPLLWFLNIDRYSKMTPAEITSELRKTTPQVINQAEVLQKEVKDTVNSQPSIKIGIEDLWDKVSMDTTKVEEFNPNW
jgi:hypothetical protein